MKVFVILESFTDYKGGNATSWGVYKDKESAKKAMRQAILDRLGFNNEDEFEETYEETFDSFYTDKNNTNWVMDDDNLVEFYIEEDNLYE